MPDRNIIEEVGNLMDKNIRGVQYVIYGLTSLGLGIALRSTRPFLKCRQASDVPKNFIDKKIRLDGKVISIRPGAKPVISIDHYPLVPLPFRNSKQLLPLKIASIEVNPNGLSWMDTLLKGSEVNFIPLKIDGRDNVVDAVIFNKEQNIGEHLVKIGFALPGEFDLSLNNDPLYKKYYKSLLSSEKQAESKGAGIWADFKPSLWQKVMQRLYILK